MIDSSVWCGSSNFFLRAFGINWMNFTAYTVKRAQPANIPIEKSLARNIKIFPMSVRASVSKSLVTDEIWIRLSESARFGEELFQFEKKIVNDSSKSAGIKRRRG